MEGEAAKALFATLKSVVQNFMEERKEQSRLISDAPKHVEQLENDISFLIEFLEVSISKPKNDNLIMRDLLRDVRNSIYDAEDAIDSLLINAAGSASRSWSRKSKLAQIATLVESCCKEVKPVRERVEQQINSDTHNARDGEFAEYEGPPGKPKYVVGFMDEEQQLTDLLSQDTQQLEVILVTGKHGIGKTTLAAKIFHDSEIKRKFTLPPIWVHVSNSTTKNIFLAILRQLDELPQDASQISNGKLSQLVAVCLEGKKFLIVMDDVLEIDDLEMLISAFDRSDKNSKVLITTTNNEVARHNHSIELQPLDPEESWDLLKQQVFPGAECPSGLEINGRLIAGQCRGLPSAIVSVADILAEKGKRSIDPGAREKIWENVCQSMDTYFSNDPTRPENASIQSTYNTLDYHLRACFLYMGIFREHFKFSVSKLTRMWIAEGFIMEEDPLSLEQTAQNYLNQLIARNLVIVDHKKPDGSAKICSMNYLLYDLCKTEAGNKRENFLEEVKYSTTDGAFRPPVGELRKYRRVCMHADVSRFIYALLASNNRSLHFRARLRSFVSHSVEMCTLKKKDISIIRAAFKVLRVLDAKPMGFTEIPSDLYQLVHLRYVTLSLINGTVLPAAISKFRKIQTLVVHTTSRSIKIEADILKMTGLRHLKTNAPATLHKTSKSCKEGEQLQTLCGISPKSCTELFFDKACNLKKLGIHGQLALLLDGKTELLRKLVNVEKLKLLNDVTTGSNSKGNLCCLPPSSQFPPSLRSLTLSATCLDWNQISILGSLHILEELKLKDNAFVGKKWEVSSGKSFPHLQALHIEGLDFEEWTSSSDDFLKLRKLELSNCENLMKLPFELPGSSLYLNKLHLSNCTISAIASAGRIRDAKRQNGTILVLHISSS